MEILKGILKRLQGILRTSEGHPKEIPSGILRKSERNSEEILDEILMEIFMKSLKVILPKSCGNPEGNLGEGLSQSKAHPKEILATS